MSCRVLLAVAGAQWAAAALAQSPAEPARFTQVDLQVDVSREVANDLMNASLYAELSDPSAPKVADELNRVAAAALKTAGEFKTVKASSGHAQTYPIYDRASKLTSWRGRTEVRLESRDVQAMAALIGKLESTMQVAGISFSASPSLRRETESELVTDAVAAFRARADIVTKALGGKGYRIRHMTLSTGGFAPGPRPLAVARMSAAAAEVTPPAFEAGTSTVNLVASGTIEVE
ncbi:MAG TPA: SIMPL domain-containing protein [Anaeromyxobacteraceae bacterium]|nr:SIMPL domain-containing protein [Anaeromyxobacteraceae bacterium]